MSKKQYKNNINQKEEIFVVESPKPGLHKHLNDNKKEILRTLKIVDDKETQEKKEIFIERLQKMLSEAISSISEIYQKGIDNLPYFNKGYFKDGVYKVLINEENKDGASISMARSGKNLIKYFIPAKNLIKTGKIIKQGDEIFVYAKKDQNDKIHIIQVDSDFIGLKKFYGKDLNKDLFYMPEHAKKPFKGKIVGPSENGKKVIFQPQKGVPMEIDVKYFLKGLERARDAFLEQQSNFQKPVKKQLKKEIVA